MKDLRDAVALVTGAGDGIGRATALALARAGCHVAINDVRADSLAPVEAEIRALGRRSAAVPADVGSREEAEAMCRRAAEALGRVDLLVNNAGIGMGGRMDDITLEEWDLILRVNLMAHIWTVREVLPGMRERGRGHLVHVSSFDGLASTGILLPYGVTKFAVVGLAEALAAQLRPAGVGVTVVCPGFVRTGIAERGHYAGLDGAERKRMIAEARSLLDRGKDPAVVGEKIVRAIRRNRFLVLTDWWERPLLWLRLLSPQLSIWINAKFTAKFAPPRA